LQGRGYRVTLFDPGPLPHPLAASTDISKAVRLDYGADGDYTALMERALEGWRRWNRDWPEQLFHEVGVLFITRAPFQPGGLEYESYQLLRQRGHPLERLNIEMIQASFPAWRASGFQHGYYNPHGGYAESGRAVAQLLRLAEASGVELRAGQAFARLHEHGSRVAGLITAGGEVFPADRVLLAAGAWTQFLLPSLKGVLRSNGMPVWHLKPERVELFRAERFPVFSADVSQTGYYGFPINREGVVKIAHHGPGRELHPESPQRQVAPVETARMRAFIAQVLPDLANAPVVYTRVCLYSDTWDGHFWIAPDPERQGLIVAAGDSGHGFKFAPVLGDLIADAVDGASNSLLNRFRWRPDVRPPQSEEATRHQT
jgi:glycine/D-amino acid oxidase-like deaminating enzyme